MISGQIRDFLSRTSVLFVLLAILWGGSFVAIEVGLHYFPPLSFAGLRYAAAGALILGYAVVAADRWRPADRDEWLTVGVVGGFIIAGHHAFLYLGEQYVSGAIAAVVVSLSPVLTVAFAAVLLDERLAPVEGVGFALGVLGVAVVAGLDPANMLSTSVVGVGLVLLATVSFALGGVLTRPFRSDLPLAAMQGWAMVSGAGALLAVGALRGESMAAVRWTTTAVGSLAYLTLLSGVIAFGVYFLLLDRVGPTQLNLVGYLEPVTAAVFGWLLLGDLVDGATVAGFGAIFLGFALVKRRALREVVAGLRSRDDEGSEGSWSGEVGPADD